MVGPDLSGDRARKFRNLYLVLGAYLAVAAVISWLLFA